MTDRWVIDEQHPDGYLVPMTAAEQAQIDKDQAEWAAAATRQQTLNANADQMRAALTAHLQDALTLADALDANTATAAQQRQGLALCLRGTVRLARLTLELYDAAV